MKKKPAKKVAKRSKPKPREKKPPKRIKGWDTNRWESDSYGGGYQ